MRCPECGAVVDAPPPPPAHTRRGTLNVDDAALADFARIITKLRSARLAAGWYQETVGARLSLSGRAVSDWETGAGAPTLGSLILWSLELGQRLAIVGPNGNIQRGPRRPRPGENLLQFERRRLAAPLRNRRVVLRMKQSELGELIGVSRDSIQRWELTRVPPRPIAHIVWARKLGCAVILQPLSKSEHEDLSFLRGVG